MVFHAATRARWLGKAAALTILLLSCAAALWLGSASKRLVGANEGLIVSEAHLNLGEIWEDERLPWTLPVRNSTTADIEIIDFDSSCNCLAIEPRSLVIPAGETADLRLTLYLSNGLVDEAALPIRNVELKIVPRIRDHLPQQAGWTIRGRVRSAVSLAPRTVYCQIVQGQPNASGTVLVTPHTRLAGLTVQCDPSKASVQQIRRQGDPARFELRITPLSALPEGAFRFPVIVQPIDTDGRPMPSLTLPVEGMVMEEVQAVPSSVLFGSRTVGEIATDTVLLQSLTGKRFEVEGMQVDSEDVTVEPVVQANVVGMPFALRQRISRPGHQLRNVTFSIRTQDDRHLKISVPLSSYGVAR
jgi:hypothetical protein